MKRLLLLSGAAMLAFNVANAQSGVKNGLAEEFSSSTCPPCASFFLKWHPAVDAVEANIPSTHINVIQYEMNWPSPGNDYGYNAHGNSRKTYYAVSGVPHLKINGAVASTSQTQAQLEAALTASKSGTSDFDITGTYKINHTTATTGTGQIDFSVKPLKTLSATYHVYAAITERHYQNPDNTVSMLDYYNVVRKMFPDGLGTAETSWTMNTAKTYTFTNNYTIVSPHPAQMSYDFWGDPYKGDLFVWVMDDATKTVLQSQVIPATFATSVEDMGKVNNVFTYPNPVHGVLTVGFSVDQSSTVQVRMVDMIGRTIYQADRKVNSGIQRFYISTDNIPAGLYNVVISNENGIRTQRVTVAK
jgi:hypothetical protein